MEHYIAVSKDPKWIRPVGLIMLVPGVFALIPFKAQELQVWDVPFFVFAGIGVLLLLHAARKTGWRLNLEGNIIYYQKFNLYSNWKKRRSEEFALSVTKIISIKIEGKELVIAYQPSKKLRFSTTGLDSFAQMKLNQFVRSVNSKVQENQ